MLRPQGHRAKAMLYHVPAMMGALHLFGAYKCLMLLFNSPVITLLSPVLQNNRKPLGGLPNLLQQ
jgi:hypothetical protein